GKCPSRGSFPCCKRRLPRRIGSRPFFAPWFALAPARTFALALLGTEERGVGLRVEIPPGNVTIPYRAQGSGPSAKSNESVVPSPACLCDPLPPRKLDGSLQPNARPF